MFLFAFINTYILPFYVGTTQFNLVCDLAPRDFLLCRMKKNDARYKSICLSVSLGLLDGLRIIGEEQSCAVGLTGLSCHVFSLANTYRLVLTFNPLLMGRPHGFSLYSCMGSGSIEVALGWPSPDETATLYQGRSISYEPGYLPQYFGQKNVLGLGYSYGFLCRLFTLTPKNV